MTNETINETIRATIKAAGAQLVSVEAVSKGGEVKQFVFSDAARPTHMKPIVTLQGARAAETRKRNNPDLMNVWDINERRWRCFNLNTVLKIKSNGIEYPFCSFRPAYFYYRGP